MYNMLYNHVSGLTCAKQGFKFKPTYNVVDEIGLWYLQFWGVGFSSKVKENHFLLFYGI